MMPATGVFPPLLMFVIVRAMAPVAGIPPKSGVTRFAIPCPISSLFELWRSPITPSATAAESKDSMAPSIAMVRAGCTSPFRVVQESAGTSAPGISELIENLSPMVSMVCTPAYSLRRRARIVVTIIAISEPGIFLLSFGSRTMMSRLTTPITTVHESSEEMFWI